MIPWNWSPSSIKSTLSPVSLRMFLTLYRRNGLGKQLRRAEKTGQDERRVLLLTMVATRAIPPTQSSAAEFLHGVPSVRFNSSSDGV
jgi:hypothetical protein